MEVLYFDLLILAWAIAVTELNPDWNMNCCWFSLEGCHAQTNQTKIEQTLIKALFKNYDSEGRPVLNLSEPVLVKFGIAYSNLHSLVSVCFFVQPHSNPGLQSTARNQEVVMSI